jgi:hypothetical protein
VPALLSSLRSCGLLLGFADPATASGLTSLVGIRSGDNKNGSALLPSRATRPRRNLTIVALRFATVLSGNGARALNACTKPSCLPVDNWHYQVHDVVLYGPVSYLWEGRRRESCADGDYAKRPGDCPS